ncbi:MAG TPA: matrixin family metalloprotease [Sandaracinaceae bacterium]
MPTATRRWTGAAAAVATALVALSAFAQEPAAPAPVRAHVYLVVLRDFPRAWIDPVARALERHLEVEAIVEAAPLPLPDDAYYAPRRRYRAERLLYFLDARFAGRPASHRVLGLTSRDISTSTERFADWGILGYADLGGRAAVVSSFRMRRRARSPEHALFRMTTTAVHEVGHTLGLPHCDEPRCIMRDAQGTMATVDAGDGTLGPRCRALLERVAPRSLARGAR